MCKRTAKRRGPSPIRYVISSDQYVAQSGPVCFGQKGREKDAKVIGTEGFHAV